MAKPDPAADRAAELREQLEYHGRRYYVLDDPEIGDDQYDALLDELRAIEAGSPRSADRQQPDPAHWWRTRLGPHQGPAPAADAVTG